MDYFKRNIFFNKVVLNKYLHPNIGIPKFEKIGAYYYYYPSEDGLIRCNVYCKIEFPRYAREGTGENKFPLFEDYSTRSALTFS